MTAIFSGGDELKQWTNLNHQAYVWSIWNFIQMRRDFWKFWEEKTDINLNFNTVISSIIETDIIR